VTTYELEYGRAPTMGRWWWLLLVSGFIWIAIGLFALEADLSSAKLIGYLVGCWLLFGGIAEFFHVAEPTGWKWLHILLGVLFVVGGVGAFLSPLQTFTVLAGLTGFFLILKGTFDVVLAIAQRHVVDLWWLVLLLGILEIAIGVWASGYPGRSAALLVLWVGLGAIVRGVAEIVAAFTMRPGGELAVA
jgi:uncharacterized membrane protein HdeD (DUF308 family)